jgi:hypothetical protein
MTARIVDCLGILSESAKDFLLDRAKDFAANAENQFMNNRQPIRCLNRLVTH